MARKQVDILLNSMFDDRGFLKAHKSFEDLVRAQKKASADLVTADASAAAQAEKADIASLNRRLDHYQKHYARKLEIARRAAPLFAEVESSRLDGLQRSARDPVLKQIASQQQSELMLLRTRAQALGRETDQFLAAKARQQQAASLGGGGRSAYALQVKADQINAQLAGGGIGGADELARIFKIGATTRFGIDALKLGTQLWKGDLEKASEVVQELPFGIGKAAKSVKELMLEWSGANAEIDKHNKAVTELERRGALIQTATSASDQLNAMLAALRVQNITDPFEQEMARARAARDEALKAVDRIAATGGDVTGERSAEARRRIQAEFRQQEDDIRHRQAVAKDAEEKAQDDGVKRVAEQRMEAAARLAELDDQIRAKELESLGQHLDAQLLMLRRSYEKRIEEAGSAEEKERLARLRALDEAALLAGNQAAPSPLRRASATVEGIQLSARFRGLAAIARGSDQDRMAQATLGEAKKQSRTLERIAKTLEDRSRVQQVELLPARL